MGGDGDYILCNLAVASVVGGVVADRVVPDTLSSIQTYGLWGLLAALLAVGLALVLWPEKRAAVSDKKDGPTFIKARNVKGLTMTDNVMIGPGTFADIEDSEAVSGSGNRHYVDPKDAPKERPARRLFSGWTPPKKEG